MPVLPPPSLARAGAAALNALSLREARPYQGWASVGAGLRAAPFCGPLDRHCGLVSPVDLSG